MSTGLTVPGQKLMKHRYHVMGAWCRRFLNFAINHGGIATIPTTDSAGNIVSQIQNSAATYTLIPDALVPAGQGIGLQTLRLFLTGAAYQGLYTFTVTSAAATVGATYTNNGVTFTVLATIAAGTTLLCSATGAPAASGTLTKATGTGDSTITFASSTTTTGTLSIQYTDGTVIASIALQTAFATATIVNIDAGTTGVTVDGTHGWNPRNAPAGKGIQAVVTSPTLGSAIDVLLVGSYGL